MGLSTCENERVPVRDYYAVRYAGTLVRRDRDLCRLPVVVGFVRLATARRRQKPKTLRRTLYSLPPGGRRAASFFNSSRMLIEHSKLTDAVSWEGRAV